MPKRASKGESGSASAPPPESKLSKFQAFETVTISRSQIAKAPYNPRRITEEAKLKLRKAMEKVGLVQPLIWNRTTGRLVGGHQRLSALDHLETSGDYMLTVAAVDVDEVREKELNVLLNNPEVCGDWDLELLQDLFDGDDELDIEAAGFDQTDLFQLFDDGTGTSQSVKNSGEVKAQIDAVKGAYDRLEESVKLKDDEDFYNVIVFRSWEDRKAFTDFVGCKDNRYIDGRVLMELIRGKKSQLALQGAEGNEAGGIDDESVLPEEPR